MDQFASSIKVNEQLLKGLEAKSQGRNVKLVGEGLTIYDGKTVVEFGSWIDLFTSMVHLNPRYSTIEKFGIMTATSQGTHASSSMVSRGQPIITKRPMTF